MKKTFSVSIAALLIAAAPAFAQSGAQGQADRPAGTPAAGQPAAKAPADPDHRFVYDTYQSNMAEVKLGELAQQKAASSEVKQFGQRLATDHKKALDELKALASSESISLPMELEAKHKATHDRLDKLSGAAFDRAFMQDMVSAHRTAVNNFRQQSKNGKDAEIKAWAAKTLPTLEEHLKQAESINTAVGTTGTIPAPKSAAPAPKNEPAR